MKKNWSLIVVAFVLLALPLWGQFSVLFARDQFLRLEDIRITVLDPVSIAPRLEEIDELNFQVDPGWTLMESMEDEGKLFLLFGKHVFQDFYAYSYTVVMAQIAAEEVCTISDERPFQMLLYGVDEERFLYGKYFANKEFELHLYHMRTHEDFLLSAFGHLYKLPQVSYVDGMTTFLLDQQWGILDSRGRPMDVDIKWKKETLIHYVVATKDFVYFFVEEAPHRFILIYDRVSKATRHVQVGEKITKLFPMDGAVLMERSGGISNYSLLYQGANQIERIREGEKFDDFCIMSPELMCWVQDSLYEVYSIKDKKIVYAKELTEIQLEQLIEEGTIFYIPLLENLRWVHLLR